MTVPVDFEDMRGMALDAQQVAELVGGGGTCVLNWTTSDGYPIGVAMAYVYRHGAFWTTTPAQRKRVRALGARPKTSVVIIKDGSSATFKGQAVIHSREDPDWEPLKEWFYAALSGLDRAPDDPGARTLRQLFDSPGRVIIETRPTLVVTFDWQKFGAALGAAVEAGVGN
jgi:hypothetical protein